VTDSPVDARLDDMSDVHQCPYCELRFTNLKELQFHIQLDHPDRKVPERRY
jgi:hydrogenase maturation factor HypF (carbamoyltransferase family)